MKTIICFLVLLFASTALAADVTLEWELEGKADGFKLFAVPSGSEFDFAKPGWQGPETTAVLTDFEEGKTYRFICRAFIGDTDGPLSNEVIYTIPEPQQTVEYPGQVKRLVIEFK